MNIGTDRDLSQKDQPDQHNQRDQTLRINQDEEEEIEEVDPDVVVIKRRPGVKYCTYIIYIWNFALSK